MLWHPSKTLYKSQHVMHSPCTRALRGAEGLCLKQREPLQYVWLSCAAACLSYSAPASSVASAKPPSAGASCTRSHTDSSHGDSMRRPGQSRDHAYPCGSCMVQAASCINDLSCQQPLDGVTPLSGREWVIPMRNNPQRW